MPDSPTAAILASIPKSDTSVEFVLVNAGDDMSTLPLGEVMAAVQMVGAPVARLAALLDQMPKLTWVHSMLAGVDGLRGIAQGESSLAVSLVVLL